MKKEPGSYRYGSTHIMEYLGGAKYGAIIDLRTSHFYPASPSHSASVESLLSPATEEEVIWLKACIQANTFISKEDATRFWKYIVVIKDVAYELATEDREGIVKWSDWVEPISDILKPDINVQKVKPGQRSHTLSIGRLSKAIKDLQSVTTK